MKYSLLVFSLSVFVVFSFIASYSIAEEPKDAFEGKELVEDYFALKDSLPENYFVDAKVTVNSSSDSPELLSTKGRMRFLQSENEDFTIAEWNPEIFDDARTANVGAVHVFNTKVKRFEGTLNSKPFTILNDSIVDNRVLGSVPESEIFNASCIHPFAFPIASLNSFKGKENGFTSVAMFKKFVCCKSTEKDGKVYTYWVAPSDKIHSYHLVVFREGLIVQKDWMFSDEATTPSRVGSKMHGFKRVASVETHWGVFEGVDVPVEVLMALNNGNFEQDYFVEANLGYFNTDSKEFVNACQVRDQTKKFVSEELRRLSLMK